MSDIGEDAEPWAPPEIQENYESALGRFVLSFNQLDDLLGEIVETALVRLNRPDLVKACVNEADFSLRLRFLDLLRHSAERQGIKDVPIEAMRSIGGERNFLAHAHFDQNPFDGGYRLIRRGRNKALYYSAERIDDLTSQANKAWAALRYAQAFYAFSDPPISAPEQEQGK